MCVWLACILPNCQKNTLQHKGTKEKDFIAHAPANLLAAISLSLLHCSDRAVEQVCEEFWFFFIYSTKYF